MSNVPERKRRRSSSRWRAQWLAIWHGRNLIILWVGCFIFVINHKEILRQFIVRWNFESYQAKELIVSGWEFEERTPRKLLVHGILDGRMVEANAFALGYESRSNDIVFLQAGRKAAQEEKIAELAVAFPKGASVKVLSCPHCRAWLNGVDPEIVSASIYGDLTWWTVFRTALPWTFVLIWGLVGMFRERRVWWYWVRNSWQSPIPQ